MTTKETSPTRQRVLRLLFRGIFMALAPLFLTGCYTVNITECTIPDNEPNRVAATNLVAGVATKHGFSQRGNQVDQSVMLASYDFLGDSSQRPVNLDVYADAGRISTLLTQSTKHKKRTEQFLSVQKDLVNGFREKFGSTVEINIRYNEEMPP